MAYFWFMIAAAGGHEDAARQRDMAAAFMTPAELRRLPWGHDDRRSFTAASATLSEAICGHDRSRLWVKSRRRRGTIRYQPSRALWMHAPGSGSPASWRPIELGYLQGG